MKKLGIVLSLLTMCFLATSAIAIDKAAISKNVDVIVAGLEAGKNVTSYNASDYNPYVFIIEENGQMVVHPSLAGKNLKEVALPIFEALATATADGTWVEYEWKGKTKHTYIKKTSKNMIVSSGY